MQNNTKEMKMRRLHQKTALLAAAAILAAAFGGCAGEDVTSSQPTDSGSSSVSASQQSSGSAGGGLSDDAGKLPISTTNEQLTILVQQNPSSGEWVENDQTKWMKEKTGIDIQFMELPSSEGAQKMKLLLTSGDYPDVMMTMPGLTISDIYDLGLQGMILPLNEYIEKYGVETQAAYQKIPYAEELMTFPDGNIYSLPYLNECYHCNNHQRMFLYQPWIDKLGLSMPSTTEELVTVLKAFKEKDPNGNGQADEIPLAGQKSVTGQPQSFLMNSFIYYSVSDMEYYVDDNGTVILPFDKDEWREGLRYIHALYADGLMAPETFTQDESQLKSMALAETPVLGSFINRFSHSVTGWKETSIGDRYKEYAVVLPLKGPDGFQQTPWKPYSSSSTAKWSITDKCKNPELAFRLGDFLLSDEATTVSLYGVEGKAWTKAAEGQIGMNGKPALYNQLANTSLEKSLNWMFQAPMCATADLRLGIAVEKDSDNMETALFNITKQYEPYKVDSKNVLPRLFFDEEQSIRLTDLNQIPKYANESAARFITGDLDLDKDWDNYIAELKAMGYDEYQSIYQTAYDAVKH